MCVCVWREREKERETDRETETEKEKETERERRCTYVCTQMITENITSKSKLSECSIIMTIVIYSGLVHITEKKKYDFRTTA